MAIIDREKIKEKRKGLSPAELRKAPIKTGESTFVSAIPPVTSPNLGGTMIEVIIMGNANIKSSSPNVKIVRQ